MKFSKHTVFVTPGFARDASDTVCVPYLQDYFRALQAARPDMRISIVAMQYPYTKRPYSWEGMDVHPMGGHNRRWAKAMVWRKTAQTIGKLHRLQPIDVLHSYWLTEATRVAARVAKRLGIPHFASAMGQDSLPANRYLQQLPMRTLQLIAVSDFNAAQLEASTGRKPNWVVPFAVAGGDVDGSANAHRPIDVLAVGNLIAVKRHDRYLRIVKMLSEDIPGLRAVIVGDGKDRAALESQAREFGLDECLEFTGILPRQEVLAMMSRAKVLVHTSEVEGTGLVLLEALGRGMHLVTTPVGVGAGMMEGFAASKCGLSDHTFGLYEAARSFLRQPVDWEARDVYPMAAMVADHLNIYGLDA